MIATLRPNADGIYTEWQEFPGLPGYARVDEEVVQPAPGEEAEYIYTINDADWYMFGLETAPHVGQATAITVWVFAKHAVSSDAVRIGLGFGVDPTIWGSITLSASAAWCSAVFEDLNLTQAQVDVLTVTVDSGITGGNTLYVYTLYADITYTQPSAIPPATFDPALATSRDYIRLALGDTDTSAPLLVDDTIDAALVEYSYNEALAILADALITEYGQMPDRYSEDQGIALQWTQRIAAWERIATLARTGQIQIPGAHLTRPGIALEQTTLQTTLTDSSSQFRSD